MFNVLVCFTFFFLVHGKLVYQHVTVFVDLGKLETCTRMLRRRLRGVLPSRLVFQLTIPCAIIHHWLAMKLSWKQMILSKCKALLTLEYRFVMCKMEEDCMVIYNFLFLVIAAIWVVI